MRLGDMVTESSLLMKELRVCDWEEGVYCLKEVTLRQKMSPRGRWPAE